MAPTFLLVLALLSACPQIAMTDTTSSTSAARPSSSLIPNITKEAIAWDATQWADGSVLDNPFYVAPSEPSNAAPGTLLKLERITNTSLFTLPPATALTRFIYQSKTLNGSLVPVSAYILWPYAPRASADGSGYQVIGWCHGTSGLSPNCAPSHHINLWQHYLAPYSLVQQGYVVVSSDYAGLGVAKTANGEPIVHEYLAGPSHAADMFYSMQAAREAFPELGKQFVVIGHSQGGAAAWAAAQRQASEPVDGYLGAVAVSPATNPVTQPDPVGSMLGVVMLQGILANSPGLKPADILTEEGQEKYALMQKLGPCTAGVISLLSGVDLVLPDWLQNPWVQKYLATVATGGKRIAGPLLVMHGEGDSLLSVNVTTASVEKTLQEFPESQLEYIRLPGLDHDPTMVGSQRIWMDWIADRFAGRAPQASGVLPPPKTAVPLEAYQAELNWYLAKADASYQTG